MKKLTVLAAMALIIGVGSVTVAQAHPSTKSGYCAEAGAGQKYKHTECRWGTGGIQHKHQCSSSGTGWIKSQNC